MDVQGSRLRHTNPKVVGHESFWTDGGAGIMLICKLKWAKIFCLFEMLIHFFFISVNGIHRYTKSVEQSHKERRRKVFIHKTFQRKKTSDKKWSRFLTQTFPQLNETKTITQKTFLHKWIFNYCKKHSFWTAIFCDQPQISTSKE
jgi:hypothetical protein